MKVAKQLIMAMMLISADWYIGYAQSTNQTYPGISRLEKVKSPKTHKAPSNVFIEYAYTGNGFYFLQTGVFESLSVTVTSLNTAESWAATLSVTEGYSIETGALSPGTYSISATTETGAEFYGEFELTN